MIIAVATLLTVAVIAQQAAWAQTPGQMEYERQQREYRQQQEQQRQEQQRQQQLMNENARRQQEESRRLNAPTGQSPAPSYQGGATPQTAPQQRRTQSNATAATAGAEWVPMGSHTANGGVDIYAARSTIRRSGNLVRMWDMWDYKTTQTIAGRRFLSAKYEHEYNCKDGRLRDLSVTAFTGQMGNGTVVDSGDDTLPWQSVERGGVLDALRKFACAGK
jgi:hypothetical protein